MSARCLSTTVEVEPVKPARHEEQTVMNIVAVQAEIEYRQQRLMEEAAAERRVRAATTRGGRRSWLRSGRSGSRRSSVQTA
jgi:hypothetical protein